ncbi:MAG: hypothetical protein JNL58_14665 [Planctomyces sp.]|nr:hypothetical protein [Planctomyces sp.]
MSDHLLKLVLSQAWQIALLTVFVAFITRVFAKSRPHLAHALWILVLVKCVTPPVWGHSLSLFSQLQAMWSSADTTNDAMPVPLAILSAKDDEALASLATGHLTTPSIAETSQQDSQDELPGLTSTGSLTTGDTAEIPVTEAAASTHNRSGSASSSQLLSGILLTIVTFGASLTFTIIVVRCIRCLRLIDRHRTTEFDDRLRVHVQQLSARLRLRRTPRVVVSNVLFGPAVLGLVRQTIVLPRCLLESPMSCQSGDRDLQFLDPILAHELLHIRRGDLRTGALQIVVRSLWWFHPAVWLCNRWLSREAERCCDEQVIAELGCSPAQYARSLLSVIETKHRLQPVPIFPGMKPVEITTQRMERIMSLRNDLQKQTPFSCWLAIVILAVFVLPGAAPQVTIEPDHAADDIPGSLPAQGNVQSGRQDAEEVSENSRQAHLVLTAYPVADLVVPAGSGRPKVDYLTVAELIKSTIKPDSWRDDWGQITFAELNLSLVIRQTPEVHAEIAKLLSQLRNDQAQIQISAQILKVSSDTQLQGVKSRCSLHPQTMPASTYIPEQQQHWALLTPARSEQLLQFLDDEKAERLSAPKIVTISDQSAFVEVESINAGQFHGCRLDVKPHLVIGSSVIRLSHSVQIGGPDDQKQYEGELKIEACLDKKVSWHFHEVPFTDVLRHIAVTHHINISLDWRELNLPATQRVSIDADGVTLRTALEMLLDQTGGYVFYITNNTLRISNQVEQGAKPGMKPGALINESLMSSGQTLLLLIEPASQSQTDEMSSPASADRFVILLTAEVLAEQ